MARPPTVPPSEGDAAPQTLRDTVSGDLGHAGPEHGRTPALCPPFTAQEHRGSAQRGRHPMCAPQRAAPTPPACQRPQTEVLASPRWWLWLWLWWRWCGPVCMTNMSLHASQPMHQIMGAVSLWTRLPALYLGTGPKKNDPSFQLLRPTAGTGRCGITATSTHVEELHENIDHGHLSLHTTGV